MELWHPQKRHFHSMLLNYTQEELEKKTHNYELIESDSVVFCVDYALNGIGSNSCGPVVLDLMMYYSGSSLH